MLEMLKAKGFNNPTIIALLSEGNEELLDSIGEGIPTWKTLVDYYYLNQAKCHRALKEGYEITFLTKDGLKSLLSIMFEMKEGEDFIDTGEYLDQVKMTDDNLQTLRGVFSKNWTISILEETSAEEDSDEEDTWIVKIEITHKPVFNI